jgi:hypothetical protein
MALVARATSSVASASTVAARYEDTAANLATASSQPALEGSAPSGGISFNAATYSARDNQGGSLARDDRQSTDRRAAIIAPSQTFAAIVEARSATSGARDGSGGAVSRGFHGILARAIAIYETNAKIIHGAMELRGANVSIRL